MDTTFIPNRAIVVRNIRFTIGEDTMFSILYGAGRRTTLVLGLISACAGILEGCGGSTNDPERLFAPGEWGVGYRMTELTYTRTVTGEDRTIPVDIWYPTSLEAAEPRVVYPIALLGRIESTIARRDAALADSDSFPVVVYSHGGGAEPRHAYPYAELLASHGFIVIAPGHVGTRLTDVLMNAFDPATRWIVDRPADVTATLDWLASPTDEWGSVLRGRAETDRVVTIGYSLGGLTSYILAGAKVDVDGLSSMCSGCAELSDPNFLAAYERGGRDTRVVAQISQAPEVLPFLDAQSLATPDVPLMLQSGQLDITNPTAEGSGAAWENGVGEHDVWIDMPTGAHLTFIPVCLTPRTAALTVVARPESADDGCGDRFMPIAAALEALAGYAHTYTRLHLLGERKWQQTLEGPGLRDGLDVSTRR